MKKSVLLFAMALLLAQPTFAATKAAAPAQSAKASYASIDVVKVMQQYSKSKEAAKWNEAQEKAIRDFIADARKQVEQAKDADKKKLEEKYTKDLAAKLEALRKNKEAKVKQISTDVEKAIQRVAKKTNYDLILPAGSVLYGTVDITKNVLDELKTTK